jgi:hypothetical protein
MSSGAAPSPNVCAADSRGHLTFELRGLIAHHGWPDVDLQELENKESEADASPTACSPG